MQTRTRVALAVAGVLAVAGLGISARPALAAGGGTTRTAAACPTEWCQSEGGCHATGTCDAYADADGDGVCDNREDAACPARGDAARQGARACRGAGHHGGRCRW